MGVWPGTNVKGSSINDTGDLEELKIGPTADMGEEGCKNPEKLPTSFMDGP